MPFISVLGDSISTYPGCNPAFYPVYYEHELLEENALWTVADTWWDQVLRGMGGTLLINNSFSGSRVSGGRFPAGCSDERTHALHRGDALPRRILIYMGFNDFGMGISPRGGEADVFTFYGAYCTMLRSLRNAYPHAALMPATLLRSYLQGSGAPGFPERSAAGHALDEYNHCILDACARVGIEPVDLAATGVRYETLDGVHPTALGHRQLSESWSLAGTF